MDELSVVELELEVSVMTIHIPSYLSSIHPSFLHARWSMLKTSDTLIETQCNRLNPEESGAYF